MKNYKIYSLLFIVAVALGLANENSISAQEFNIFLNTQECLEFENASFRDDVRVKVSPCDASSQTQRFLIVSGPRTGFVNIKANTTRCIEIRGADTNDGTAILQWNCDGSREQTFELTNGIIPSQTMNSLFGPIRFSHSGKCFDAGSRPWVQQMRCNNSLAQSFEIRPVSTFVPSTPNVTHQVEIGFTRSYSEVWNNLGSAATSGATFWRPNPQAGFSRVGHRVSPGFQTPQNETMVLKAVTNGALSSPVGYELLWTDSGSSAFKDGSVWIPRCPINYESIGDVTSDSHAQPSLSEVMCVHSSALISANLGNPLWNNSGSTAITNFGSWDINPPSGSESKGLFIGAVSHIRPNDPAFAVKLPTVPIAISPDDQFWNSIVNSTNAQDFRNYLARFGQAGKHANDANRKIVDLTTKTPISQDDQFWNSIANSTNPQDFRNYLSRFGQNGKHANDANRKIVDLSAPVSPDDQFWNSIAKSTNPQDFRNYLNRFGQTGKHSTEANRKIVDLTAPVSPDDQFWNSIAKSTNPQDFRNYLNRFGQTGKHSTEANRKIVDLTTPLSPDDQFWNSIAKSSNIQDFRNYLSRFGQSGKHSAAANQKIVDLSNPTIVNPGSNTSEDIFWRSIENSTDRKVFENYLLQFGQNGKYAPIARLKLDTIKTPEELDDEHWNRIKNSRDSFDFKGYINSFPNGKNKRTAMLAITRLDQEQEKVDFLRNAQFGSLSEISNMRKVFITVSDSNSRDRIVSELQKKVGSINIVGNPQSADFFLEYKLTVGSACDPGASVAENACEIHTGELWIHTKGLVGTGNQFNRILWTTTKTKTYSAAGINFFEKNPAAQAADDLVKALKNAGFQ